MICKKASIAYRAKRAIQARLLRAKYPEREKEYRRINRLKLRIYHRDWSAKHPDNIKAAAKRWRTLHPDAWRKWADKNKEHLTAWAANYRRINKLKLNKRRPSF